MIGHPAWELFDCVDSVTIAPKDCSRYFVSSSTNNCRRTLEAGGSSYPKHLPRGNPPIPNPCLFLFQRFKLVVDRRPVIVPRVEDIHKSLQVKSATSGYERFGERGRHAYENGEADQESFLHLKSRDFLCQLFREDQNMGFRLCTFCHLRNVSVATEQTYARENWADLLLPITTPV